MTAIIADAMEAGHKQSPSSDAGSLALSLSPCHLICQPYTGSYVSYCTCGSLTVLAADAMEAGHKQSPGRDAGSLALSLSLLSGVMASAAEPATQPQPSQQVSVLPCDLLAWVPAVHLSNPLIVYKPGSLMQCWLQTL